MASSHPNRWVRKSPSVESTPSPLLQQITDKMSETSASNGSDSGNKSKIGKGWRSFSNTVTSQSPDDIIRRGTHVPNIRPPNGSSNGDNSNLSKDHARFLAVGRKKNFRHMQRVNGQLLNVMEGLELHTGVFNAEEQKKIVDCIYEFQEKGRRGQLRERTYSEPRKWMRGKGRVTIQFGCCYNYATDKNGNPPGIIRDEEVDPIPPLLKMMIKRMVSWHVLPPTCVPNSCIVNIYDKDDCIPPHIDHHDFVRPFCTVSFLAECNILFGTELKVLGPGEFSGSASIPLPLGSVLILKGNGADVAKHCVPAVPAKRISITFRKMDDTKLPYEFIPDRDLQNLKPLAFPATASPQSVSTPASRTSPQSISTPASRASIGSVNSVRQSMSEPRNESGERKEESGIRFGLGQDDFPALGSGSMKMRRPGRSLRQ